MKKLLSPLGALRLSQRATPFFTLLRILLSLLQAMLPTVFMALATASFVDTALAIFQGRQPSGAIYVPLLMLGLVLGAITTLGSVVSLVDARIVFHLQCKLKPDIVKKHAALDFRHIENAQSWELISRVSRDPVRAVMDGFQAFMQMLQVVVRIASVLVLIAAQVWWAAFIIIAFSVPMFWLSMRAGKKNFQAGREAEQYNRRVEYLDDVLTGRDQVEERSLFGYGDKVRERWREQFDISLLLRLKVAAKMFSATNLSGTLLTLVGLLVAIVLINPVMAGTLMPGMFMGIVSSVFGMIQQLGSQMSRSLENIARAGEYMKDLSAFYDLEEAENALCVPDPQALDFASLEFRNVRFCYPSGEHNVLDGVSFKLERGRHYAFVGKNGAGKTTITKLLTGLYTQYEGEILINGKELRSYSQAALKALFSLVYQDFAKYCITLKENIELGDVSGDEARTDRIRDAVRLAGLEDVAAAFEEGVDIPLGKIREGGQDLSGGEWQRVAMARALMSRAPIKILDEPTASMDPIIENRVYEEFEKLMDGKTTIFISHRLGSTKLADVILVFDEGRVIQHGTHEELMSAGGLYAEMFESQRSWYR